MSDPLPFRVPAGTPIVGQLFTLTTIGVPVNATLACNCGGADTAVTIAMSQPGMCPSCHRAFNMVFNPTTGKIEMAIAVPQAAPPPS